MPIIALSVTVRRALAFSLLGLLLAASLAATSPVSWADMAPPSPPAATSATNIGETAAELPDTATTSADDEISTGPTQATPASPLPMAFQQAVARVEQQLPQTTLALLGESIEPGAKATLQWRHGNQFDGAPSSTPVIVVNGTYQGPTICLTGAVHGDEINGVESIRRIVRDIHPEDLAGSIIAVPIVNQMAFRRGSRYLPDRRDLNRYFPGRPTGSAASRLAHSLFTNVIQHCHALVDFHTGSFHRTNIPQLRADLRREDISWLVNRFGDIVVIHSEGAPGMLRHEATIAGIPTITLEAGEATRIQEDVIDVGISGINALLINLGMIDRPFFWRNHRPVYLVSRWERAEQGGLFVSKKDLGDTVKTGELLGHISDPFVEKRTEILAQSSGKIIGMALNQMVLPGYAIYHIAIDQGAIAEEALSSESIQNQLQQLEDTAPGDHSSE